MINSLSKDSHITQSFCLPMQKKARNEKSQYQGRVATVDSYIGTSVSKPAEISFGGFTSAQLANDKNFKLLYGMAENFIGKGKPAEVSKLLKEVAESSKYLISKLSVKKSKIEPSTPSANTLKFFKQNEKLINKTLDLSADLVKDDSIIKIIDSNNIKDGVKISKRDKNGSIMFRKDSSEIRNEVIASFKDASDAFPYLKHGDKKPWYVDNKLLNSFLSFAHANNVAFSATFALLLTCVLRPASIMTLPSDKKNKDDQKYAAAHSIASGVIGYICAWAVSKPIKDALDMVIGDPHNRAKVGSEKNGGKAIPFIKGKNADYIENSLKANDFSKNVLLRSSDIIMAVPKALITIALIPIILKNVFGWEKKKSGGQNSQQIQNTNSAKPIEIKNVSDKNAREVK